MKERGIKKTSVPLLYKINYPEQGQYGYLVKMNRRKKKVHEIFSFARYKNQKECRKDAEKYARELDRKYPRMTRREIAQLRRSNFDSDMVGVRKVTKTVKGHTYEFWEASWSPSPNVVRKKLFSVNKYGDDKARKLARKVRREGLKEMED